MNFVIRPFGAFYFVPLYYIIFLDDNKFDSIEDLIKFVTRYCSKTVMTETRILKYENSNVTCSYIDYKLKEYHGEVTKTFF
ncbi:MAG: transposase [Bacilli bacterium]|nr:transposase [Bacilli bacterium]